MAAERAAPSRFMPPNETGGAARLLEGETRIEGGCRCFLAFAGR
jgi:hypothetical protein